MHNVVAGLIVLTKHNFCMINRKSGTEDWESLLLMIRSLLSRFWMELNLLLDRSSSSVLRNITSLMENINYVFTICIYSSIDTYLYP